jgi:hypothetical protein
MHAVLHDPAAPQEIIVAAEKPEPVISFRLHVPSQGNFTETVSPGLIACESHVAVGAMLFPLSVFIMESSLTFISEVPVFFILITASPEDM